MFLKNLSSVAYKYLKNVILNDINRIESALVVDRSVVVVWSDQKKIQFEDCWLRDHCRCSECFRLDTFQRANHILDIPDAQINRIKFDADCLTIEWDDKHKSVYKTEFLIEFDYQIWRQNKVLKPIPWKGNAVSKNVTKMNLDQFLNTADGAKSVFQSLLDYGVVIVDGVEPTLEATEKVCKAMGGVQHTLFGGMWQFTTKAEHADSAYTDLPLAAHNDSTYFTESTGLQLLHCVEHSNGTGGNTLLVDGFYGAARLREEHPEDFEFLSSFDVEAEYIEDGHHHKYSAPIIRLDKHTNKVIQVRYNVYDRSPMAFENGEQCRKFYKALRNLSKYYQDEDYQWHFKLQPGMVLAIDNFRVLHGRTAFTGKRVLCGSYVARSDWLDKARTLGLIQ